MKKILSWVFRDTLELNKHWWHRLIKVGFIALFFLTVSGSYITILVESPRKLQRPHNITIKNTLYQFTENYSGNDNENTIQKFFEQNGEFGLRVGNTIEYISLYSLGKSLCIKTPEKHLSGISKTLFEDYINTLSYTEQKNSSITDFEEEIKKMFYEDTSRKCWFFGLNSYDENLKKQSNLSGNIINYSPNFLYYLEATLMIGMMAFLSFVILALVYYHVLMYIVYGSKK